MDAAPIPRHERLQFPERVGGCPRLGNTAAVGERDLVTMGGDHRPRTATDKGVAPDQIALLGGLKKERSLFRRELREKGERRLAIRHQFHPDRHDRILCCFAGKLILRGKDSPELKFIL